MIDLNPINTAIEQIKKVPLIHQEIIEELYRKNSVNHLEILGALISIDDFFKDKPHVYDYIENKIKQIRIKEELEFKQLGLDVQSKRRQAKAFWPLLIFSIITGFSGMYFSYEKSKPNNDTKRIDTMSIQLKQLQLSISTLYLEKKVDSTHTLANHTQR